jgi:hypothetical protein
MLAGGTLGVDLAGDGLVLRIPAVLHFPVAAFGVLGRSTTCKS